MTTSLKKAMVTTALQLSELTTKLGSGTGINSEQLMVRSTGQNIVGGVLSNIKIL